jgi:hypothetical protein
LPGVRFIDERGNTGPGHIGNDAFLPDETRSFGGTFAQIKVQTSKIRKNKVSADKRYYTASVEIFSGSANASTTEAFVRALRAHARAGKANPLIIVRRLTGEPVPEAFAIVDMARLFLEIPPLPEGWGFQFGLPIAPEGEESKGCKGNGVPLWIHSTVTETQEGYPYTLWHISANVSRLEWITWSEEAFSKKLKASTVIYK